jgi:hypothetical protein
MTQLVRKDESNTGHNSLEILEGLLHRRENEQNSQSLQLILLDKSES